VRPFPDVSRWTQVGRLRRVAQRALREWRIDADRVVAVHHMHNTTFKVGARGRTYALRVYRPGWRSPEEIAGEMEWLRALGRETDLGPPRPARDIVTIPAATDLDADRLVALFTWVPGANLNLTGRPVEDRHARSVGQVVAALHDHASTWAPPSGFARPNCRGIGMLGTGGEIETLLPHERERIEPLLRRCEEAIDRLDTAGSEFGLVHSDVHVGNVRFDGQRPRPIDFDDSCLRHHAFDLAVSVEAISHRPRGAALVEALLEGYRAMRPLPARFEDELAHLRLARRLETILWISYFRHDRGFIGDNVTGWIAELLVDLDPSSLEPA
jgi:Ser/Thr protein kinase RdoA (MazF antagonist)